jgi:DNA recombination protein RmuC
MEMAYGMGLSLLAGLGLGWLMWGWRRAGGGEGMIARLDGVERALERGERLLREEMARGREESREAFKATGESVVRALGEMGTAQHQSLEGFARQVGQLTAVNEQKLEHVRAVLATGLHQMQEDNNRRLEQMRATVEEKLQGTLERRLGESFRLVSERLEVVHKGLGEMRDLAAGVGDLKRVLTNVKTRGTWGEIQLGALLEQILTPEQYAVNVAPRPTSPERVEFAIKLPGRDELEGQTVWMPLDAKFPKEEYERLLAAQDRADPGQAEESAKRLEEQVRKCARDIRDKYVCPPYTTDFGVLFLPVEGLYAEVIRRPGLVESLQQNYRVVVAGPTTLAALLNALQMGFRTLAIQKRSSEVWKLLGAVKTEFGRFTDHLEAVQKKLHQASDSIEDAARKSRLIQRRLKDVQEVPASGLPLIADHEGE